MKISEIIAKVEAYHGPLEEGRRTCDIVQYGDPEKECTGIVTTCCPTAAVIRKAAQLGYNFVLGHEPLFYDGWDETDWLQENGVYQAKKQLLDETGIVVYRDHDHMHNQRPDGIFSGLTKLLGWEPYVASESFMPGCVYDLPAATVGEIARHMAKVMGISGMRMVGDPQMEVSRAAVVPVWSGGKVQYLAAFLLLKEPDGLSSLKRAIQLKKQAAAYLPDYMIPRKLFAVESFPFNVNGKVDKKALARRLEETP